MSLTWDRRLCANLVKQPFSDPANWIHFMIIWLNESFAFPTYSNKRIRQKLTVQISLRVLGRLFTQLAAGNWARIARTWDYKEYHNTADNEAIWTLEWPKATLHLVHVEMSSTEPLLIIGAYLRSTSNH